MVLAIFLTCLFLILPIFVSVYLYYDVIDKRLYFAIFLYNQIKITSGYIVKRKNGGFYVHTNKKAYIFDNETLNKLKSSDIDLTKALQTRTFNLYIDIGLEDVNLIILGASIYYLLQNIGKVYTEKYNYFNYLTDLNIYDTNKKLISIKLKHVVSFNILGILSKIIANLISKGVKNAKKHSKA